MVNKILPNKHDSRAKSDQIQEMFDRISKNYDRLNRIITFGMYSQWKKKVVDIIQDENPKTILDLATGTADFALAMKDIPGVKIRGVDISEQMLEVGRSKVNKAGVSKTIDLQIGDAESLQFQQEHFDLVLVSFGLRNFENLDKGLAEIFRVLKKGGCLITLETSVPKNWFMKLFYLLYTRVFMPSVARILTGEKAAYSYLSKSAQAFPCPIKLRTLMTKTGFFSVEFKPLNFGVSTIHIARKPINEESI
ncbi:MAG: bifunctional demethylmenaquinone methyltransferase/2-methoxy-6-polyprenyl-1,4-benzoquinol methylase UbiE [Flavobacteriaceae bacterium]|nr:bifunctional demethylmenaquinone methyltransferase/2-methoxy-6-polyprenyl-1,4-benzoquinol methylase UbiE [Flavobacteriaceae bacterium]